MVTVMEIEVAARIGQLTNHRIDTSKAKVEAAAETESVMVVASIHPLVQFEMTDTELNGELESTASSSSFMHEYYDGIPVISRIPNSSINHLVTISHFGSRISVIFVLATAQSPLAVVRLQSFALHTSHS
jgi:hypothetical protein